MPSSLSLLKVPIEKGRGRGGGGGRGVGKVGIVDTAGIGS